VWLHGGMCGVTADDAVLDQYTCICPPVLELCAAG
jgi:hypothetical protein